MNDQIIEIARKLGITEPQQVMEFAAGLGRLTAEEVLFLQDNLMATMKKRLRGL